MYKRLLYPHTIKLIVLCIALQVPGWKAAAQDYTNQEICNTIAVILRSGAGDFAGIIENKGGIVHGEGTYGCKLTFLDFANASVDINASGRWIVYNAYQQVNSSSVYAANKLYDQIVEALDGCYGKGKKNPYVNGQGEAAYNWYLRNQKDNQGRDCYYALAVNVLKADGNSYKLGLSVSRNTETVASPPAAARPAAVKPANVYDEDSYTPAARKGICKVCGGKGTVVQTNSYGGNVDMGTFYDPKTGTTSRRISTGTARNYNTTVKCSECGGKGRFDY
jgi:hypothetical protein